MNLTSLLKLNDQTTLASSKYLMAAKYKQNGESIDFKRGQNTLDVPQNPRMKGVKSIDNERFPSSV